MSKSLAWSSTCTDSISSARIVSDQKLAEVYVTKNCIFTSKVCVLGPHVESLGEPLELNVQELKVGKVKESQLVAAQYDPARAQPRLMLASNILPTRCGGSTALHVHS